MNHPSPINPQLLIDDLLELQALTSTDEGAQRMAWTETWDRARAWLAAKLADLPVTVTIDQAGNLWATLPGASQQALVMGSHIDSVPNGGWLDGCLGVVAGLEVLRRFASQGASQGQPPVTIRLMASADEEGSQFGPSLFTSGLLIGSFDLDELKHMTDHHGKHLAEVIGEWGVNLDQAGQAIEQLDDMAAYLELHIEQGPVLESLGLPLAAVTGSLGVERHTIYFNGQTAHSGSTPMSMRRDAVIAASRLALEIRQIANRHGGVCTMGSVITRPGIATAVSGECECTLDQRHLDPAALAAMWSEAQDACRQIAAEEQVDITWSPLYQIKPITFTPDLIELCQQAVAEVSGQVHSMPSGPLHDACAMALAGRPVTMMFVQSLRGLSHTKEEDTRREHLLLAMQAFDRLADKTVAWILSQAQTQAEA